MTTWSSLTASGVAPAAAVGAWLATTTMSVIVAVSMPPWSSVTFEGGGVGAGVGEGVAQVGRGRGPAVAERPVVGRDRSGVVVVRAGRGERHRERGLAGLGRDVFVATAVGGRFGTGSTTMLTEAVPVAPSLSVTVRVTGCVPDRGEGEAGLGVGRGLTAAEVPEVGGDAAVVGGVGAVEVRPRAGPGPRSTSVLITATGWGLASTVTVTESVAGSPLSSVTVSVGGVGALGAVGPSGVGLGRARAAVTEGPGVRGDHAVAVTGSERGEVDVFADGRDQRVGRGDGVGRLVGGHVDDLRGDRDGPAVVDHGEGHRVVARVRERVERVGLRGVGRAVTEAPLVRLDRAVGIAASPTRRGSRRGAPCRSPESRSITGTGDALAADPTWITFWLMPMAFELSVTVSLTT